MSETANVGDGARYGALQRLFHWIIAVVVLGALAGGGLLWAYGFDGLQATFGPDMTNTIYKYHKTAGVLILGLMLLRLLLRFAFGAPPPPRSLSPTVATLSRATHLAFYVLLILMAGLGWAATATGDFPVQFFDLTMPPIFGVDKALSETLYELHGIVGGVIAALVVLHIGAGLRHWLVLRDGVMHRISLP